MIISIVRFYRISLSEQCLSEACSLTFLHKHSPNSPNVHGALRLETIEARPIFEGDAIRALQVEESNRAKDIIEDFMIAANGVTARYLSSREFPSIRRVVRTPKRWDRIVEVAREHKFACRVIRIQKRWRNF